MCLSYDSDMKEFEFDPLTGDPIAKPAPRPIEPAKQIAATDIASYSAKVDIETLCRELEQARVLAIANEEPSAAISATMAKAKLFGLLVDRSETTIKRPEDMTEAEILKALGFETIEQLMASNGQLIEHQPVDDTIN